MPKLDRRAAPSSRIGLTILMVAVGVACIGTAVAAIINGIQSGSSDRIQGGPHEDAKVLQVLETQGTGYQVLVQYQVDGRVHQASLSYRTDSTHPPSSVPIAYDPGNPNRVEIHGQPRYSATNAAGFAESAVAFALFEVILILWRRRRGRRT